MLHQFLTENRETLITRCREKVAKRTARKAPTPKRATRRTTKRKAR